MRCLQIGGDGPTGTRLQTCLRSPFSLSEDLRKGFFLQQKMCFFTTSCTSLPHEGQTTGLQLGLQAWPAWGAAACLERIVVKKNLLCCKKKTFSGCRPASGLHLGCLTTSKKVFFYNRKGFFLLLLASPPACGPNYRPAAGPAWGLHPAWHEM